MSATDPELMIPTNLERVVGLFSTNEVSFPADRGAEARECQGAQKARWLRLINMVEEVAFEHIGRIGRQIPALLTPIVNDADFTVSRTDQAIVVTGNIPVLPEIPAGVFANLTNQELWLVIAGVVILAAPAFKGQGNGASFPDDAKTFLTDPRFIRASQDWFMMTRFNPAFVVVRNEVTHFTEALAKKDRRSLKELTDQAKAAVGDVRSQAAQLSQQSKTARSQFDEDMAAVRKEWAAFTEGARAEIAAARAQATEAGIMTGATQLWSRKATRHAISFWLGLLTLVCAVAASLYLLAEAGPRIFASLPKKTDGEVSYVVAFSMVAAIVGVGWLLRFLGRFVTENMMMQSDAVQRRVMLQTYLSLVGDANAKMEQADRTLVLNAIFRPLPGHQSEDVAPPTLADVVKSATGKG